MALERVFLAVSTESATVRMSLTARSTVRLEWASGGNAGRRDFETIEDALEFVTVQPEEFDSELYQALLHGLEQRGGGAA